MAAKRTCKVDGCGKARQGSPYCQEHAETAPDVPRCDYPACTYARLTGGLCQRHAAQVRRGLEPKPIVDWTLMPCRVVGCGVSALGRGRMCKRHLTQSYKKKSKSNLRPIVIGLPCSQPGCEKPNGSNLGLCKKHADRNSHLRREYGITLAESNALAESQDHVCKICGHSPGVPYVDFLEVDHCHDTGRVRGLLCGPCNRAIGLMQDNPSRLVSAARYLESTPCTPEG